MLKLFIIATVLISCSREKYVLFMYMGPSDRPIECLVVVKNDAVTKKVCEMQTKYNLASKDYERFEKYIITKDPIPKVFDTTRTFGSFRVIIDGKESYFIPGRQNCIEYFTKLSSFSKSDVDPRLAELIEESILIRIRGMKQ